MPEVKYACYDCAGNDAPPCVLSIESGTDLPVACPFSKPFTAAHWIPMEISLKLSIGEAKSIVSILAEVCNTRLLDSTADSKEIPDTVPFMTVDALRTNIGTQLREHCRE